MRPLPRSLTIVSMVLVPRLGWAFAAAAIAFTGCSREGTVRSRGDEIVTQLDRDPPGLNPLVVENGDTYSVTFITGGYLLRTDERGRLIPDLAITVPTVRNGGISRDGLMIHYRLRSDATWHDGAKFSARDVVFSFRKAMDPAVNVPDRSGYDDVAWVRADAPDRVTVRLKAPYSPAVATFFALSANEPYPLLPEHVLKNEKDLNRSAFNGHPIGLGPFRVASWDRGNRVVLERYDRYFRGKPPLKRIIMRIIPDHGAQLVAWRTGELDYLGMTGDPVLTDAVLRLPRTKVTIYARNTFQYLLMQQEHGPLSDPRLRAALVTAIDRATIMRRVRGEYHLAGDGDRLPGQFAYDSTIHQRRYDPIRAARLFDASGWQLTDGKRVKNGVPLELTLAIGTSPSSRRFAVLLQEQLATLGVAIWIRSYIGSVLYSVNSSGILPGAKFDLYFGGWDPGGVHDDSYLWRCDTRPPAGANFSRICDPEIDRNAKIELATTDSTVEANADRAILRRLIAGSFVLFLGFLNGAIATREGLEDIKPSAIVRSNWNAWEWHWTK